MEELQGRTVCPAQPTTTTVATQEQHQQAMLGHDKLSTGEGIQQSSLANDTTPGTSAVIMRHPGESAVLPQNPEHLPPRTATSAQLSESRVGGEQDRGGRELLPLSGEGVAGGGDKGRVGNICREPVDQGSCIATGHDRPKSPGSEVAEKDKSRKRSRESTQEECRQKDDQSPVKHRGESLSKTGQNRRARRWSKRVGGNTMETSTEARNAQSSREDDYSTIVWYRTIVACLTAAS